MPITLAGVVPVSAVNIGLSASLAGLTAQVSKLTADLSKLPRALAAQIQVTADLPPNVPGITAALGAQLNPAELGAQLLPGSFPTLTADANVELGIELGLISAQIAAVDFLVGGIELGLGASGISGWSYAGRASGFGAELEADTAAGYGKTPPTASIQGLVIATESFSSWGAFSRGVRTNSSGAAASSGQTDLGYLGELGANKWNTGTADLFARLRLYLDGLKAARAAVLAQIQFAIGLDLPAPDVILNAGLAVVANIGIDGIAANLGVTIDLSGASIRLQIDALLSLIADISAQLSAGGLALWTYSGTAGDFGASLKTAIKDGIPGGSGANAPAYGLALAGSSGSMGAFGTIFKTG